MIQAYEQGDQDIMKAEARTVFALARVLGWFYSAKTIHFYTILAGLNFLFSQNRVFLWCSG